MASYSAEVGLPHKYAVELKSLLNSEITFHMMRATFGIQIINRKPTFNYSVYCRIETGVNKIKYLRSIKLVRNSIHKKVSWRSGKNTRPICPGCKVHTFISITRFERHRSIFRNLYGGHEYIGQRSIICHFE